MNLIVKRLGLVDYAYALDQMRAWVEAQADIQKTTGTSKPEELWSLQHPSVYTQGKASKPEHLLNPNQIPLITSDRGGQITYHGPGQLVCYMLLNLKSRHWGPKALVKRTEQAILGLLAEYDIQGHLIEGAPGIYVDHQKIASLGFRIRKGFSYHGLSLNVAMDLSPFNAINPCGHAGLNMTQLTALTDAPVDLYDAESKLLRALEHQVNRG